MQRDPPWRAGLQSARANLVPGLVVQAAMLALLLAYFFYPPARGTFETLAELKGRWGYFYSFLAALIAGALIPELLRILVFQRGRIIRRNFANLLFTIPVWGLLGILVDFLYRQQAIWFGDDLSIPTVASKVLVDQFLYNPLIAAPLQVWLYDWKNQGYSFRGTGRFFTLPYYLDHIVPTLIATWGLWLPICTILYSLPLLLQIPLFALALSLWVMLYTWMSERRGPNAPPARTPVA